MTVQTHPPVRWVLALGLGLGALALLGSAASGQAAPAPVYDGLYAGVILVPETVSAPGQEATLSGPGFPNGKGCVSGTISAVPTGQALASARPLEINADLDAAWSVSFNAFTDGPFTAGTFDIVLRCIDDDGIMQTRSTAAVLTVTEGATVTLPTTSTSSTTSTTAPVNRPQPDTVGTVEPSTAKPGVTELTLRGGGFAPGQELQISLGAAPELLLARTQSSTTGTYAALLTLPVTAPPGAQRLRVSGPGVSGGTHATQAALTVADLDCSDFESPAAAQVAIGTGGDPHRLDADGDGEACEAAGAASAGSRAQSTPAGTLAKTGGRFTPAETAVGLSVVAIGAFLVHLSRRLVVPGDPSVLPNHRAETGRGDGPRRSLRHRRRR